MTRLSWAKRFALAVTACALAGSFAVPASASPSSKTILDEGHVDSPKVFWEKDSLTIKAEPHKQTPVPLENGLHWLHKAWDGEGKQYFYYKAADDAKYRFLGQPGDLLYWGAPINADGGSPTNLWIGYGADTDIPVDKFRDGIFQLELVDFQGPGKMEMFRDGEEDSPLERLLSSHDKDYRFLQLSAAAHTHINTTFSKPGSYQLTYRTTYRDADTGQFVASEPQVMHWQVGGSNPREAKLGDVLATYNASKATGKTTSFKHDFTIAPSIEKDPMATLTFDTGDSKATGNVAFYIDGYYMAEAPLTNGKASWTEMIGSQESKFQAVYVPNNDSTAPRWITAPLSYKLGAAKVSTTDSGEFLAPTNENVPAKNLEPMKVTSKKFTMSSKLDGENYVITATPEDENLEFGVQGGFGSSYSDALGNCPVNFTSTRSSRSTLLPKAFFEEECASGQGHWELTPATQYDAARATVKVDKAGEFNVNGTFADAKDSGSSKPPAGDKLTPGDQSTDPSKVAILNEPITIKSGHIDYGPILMPDGSLRMIVGDDSRTKETKSVLRETESVTLEATLAARARSQRNFGDASYNFLGELGTPMYTLHQNQVPGLVWPGFSTERLSKDAFPKGTTIRLKATSVPDGAKAWAFTSGMSGLQTMLVDSTADSTEIKNDGPAHIHANWVFTKPGTYEFSIQASAEDKTGTTMTSEAGKIRIVVKDKTPGKIDQDDSAKQDPTDSNKPSDKLADSSAANGSPGTQQRTAGTGASKTKPAVEQCIPTPIETEVAAPVAKAAGGSYTVPANTHVHPNWVFTKPGTYKVTLTQTAELKNGKRVQATGTLTFNVGGAGNADSGHFDIGSVLEGDNLLVKVKDDRTQPAKWVDPGTLTFGLGAASKTTAPAGIEFIAPKGSEIWMISSAAVNGVPWVGANTQHPSIVSGTTGAVTWSLSNITGPGQLAVFSSGNLGKIVGQRWFGGAAGATGKLPAGVQKKGDKFIKTVWVGKTPSGKDCQLSPEQIAKLKAEGKLVSSAQTKALSHTGATVATLAGVGAILLAVGAGLTLRKRRAQ
ncbi:choice-of-anchor M domain-containing protein [Trueperella pyogenes]|uniref:choice-of-anchor M domain-containing protein n=1 Tax=Trueperella pyogenes TaxID=1661 RepID=UPI003249E6CC